MWSEHGGSVLINDGNPAGVEIHAFDGRDIVIAPDGRQILVSDSRIKDVLTDDNSEAHDAANVEWVKLYAQKREATPNIRNIPTAQIAPGGPAVVTANDGDILRIGFPAGGSINTAYHETRLLLRVDPNILKKQKFSFVFGSAVYGGGATEMTVTIGVSINGSYVAGNAWSVNNGSSGTLTVMPVEMMNGDSMSLTVGALEYQLDIIPETGHVKAPAYKLIAQ